MCICVCSSPDVCVCVCVCVCNALLYIVVKSYVIVYLTLMYYLLHFLSAKLFSGSTTEDLQEAGEGDQRSNSAVPKGDTAEEAPLQRGIN